MPPVWNSAERALDLEKLRNGAALVYTGFGATVSQVLLFRDFLVGFYGNELSIGIFFAGWLFWVGVGSWLGNFFARQIKSLSSFLALLLISAPASTLVQILAIRFSRIVLGTPTGEYTPLFDLTWFCFALLSFGCMLWGMLFTLGSKSLLTSPSAAWVGSNKGYVLESLGSAVGGILYSLVLVRMFAPLQVLALTIFIGLLTATALQFAGTRTRKSATFVLILLAVCLLVGMRPLVSVENEINARRWGIVNESLTYVSSIDTKYQHLALLRLGDQHTIYTDGMPTYNIPNTYDAEIFVHTLMVHGYQPKNIVVLGGGFNGILRELLKYDVQCVEYVEIDPAIIDVAVSVLPREDILSLYDPRVRVIQEDARRWLEQAEGSFDVVIVGVGEPSTASLNRYYTGEFYQTCWGRLSRNGILVISFPSSPDYLSDELKQFNASIYHTFKRVFPNNLLIPGNRALLIGLKGNRVLLTAPDSLSAHFSMAGIPTQYFSAAMFEEVMDASRREYVRSALENVRSPLANYDMSPVAYYLDMLLWNRFLKVDNRLFEEIGKPEVLAAASVGMLGMVALSSLVYRRRASRRKFALAVMMMLGGLTCMSVSLLLFLNFQVTFGSIYEMVGAVVSLNMLGLASGAYLISKVGAGRNDKAVLAWSVIGLIALLIALTPLMTLLLELKFPLLTLLLVWVAGGVTGALYSSINRLFLRESDGLGSVYAMDVLGASLGSLSIFSIFLPVFGSQGACMLLAALIFSSGLIFRWTCSDA